MPPGAVGGARFSAVPWHPTQPSAGTGAGSRQAIAARTSIGPELSARSVRRPTAISVVIVRPTRWVPTLRRAAGIQRCRGGSMFGLGMLVATAFAGDCTRVATNGASLDLGGSQGLVVKGVEGRVEILGIDGN